MSFKIERLGGTENMHNTAETCSNCREDGKCRRREFSEQAWSVLVLWNEVQMTAVDAPICEDCYNELRETLIDRADEIEAALSEPAPAQKHKQRPVAAPAKAPAAAAPRSAPAKAPAKVRKAS